MKRRIEIEDTLLERVGDAKDQLKLAAAEYVHEHREVRDSNELFDLMENWIADIAESATPRYIDEVDGIYYLHTTELDEAAMDAGYAIDQAMTPQEYRRTAIYFFIKNQLRGHWSFLTGYVDATIRYLNEEYMSEIAEAGG
jgi:hypothetical protein